MKISGLDSLVFHTVKLLHGVGRIQTVRRLKDVQLDHVHGILVAVTTAMGDSITFTPALTALRHRFPNARIVGLYHHVFAKLFESDPRFDRIIPYHGKYRKLLRTVRALREESCEVALLPYMNDPDIIPLVLSGGSRVLFRMPGRNTIYSFLVAEPELLSSTPPADHSNIRGTDMMKFLACQIQDHQSSLYPPAGSSQRIMTMLNAVGVRLEEHLLVIFHPGASVSWKRWPVTHYAGLAKQLFQRRSDVRILLTGSPAEQNLCERICRETNDGRTVNLAGEIPIHDMPELLRAAGVLVSGDTGVAVMAYAMSCRTVTLFWNTNPAVSGPLEAGGRHRVLKGASCESITPEDVLTSLLEQIKDIEKETHVRNIR